MKEYRIAFFTADWNYELVESSLRGLQSYVREHPNTRLYTFDCFGKDQDSDKDKSEYMIYDLADLSRFDGVLLQSNQIVLERVRESLSTRIIESGIPAVTIGCKVDGCTHVCIDNAAAQHDIAEHVIRAHGARRLVYLTGMMDNGCPEGGERLSGFLAACRENSIPEENIEILPASWRTSDGAEVARQWIRDGKALPDAFVCANDEMALGLMEAFAEHGVCIPRDTLVVGYDNVNSAELSSPRLSTVEGDYAQLNHFALQVLIDKINGQENRGQVIFPHRLICSESCGCPGTSQPGHIRDLYFQQTRFLKNFHNMQDQIAEDLFNASDLTELMDIIEKSHSIFGCENVYLCINDFYYDNYEKKNWYHEPNTFGDEVVLAACGSTAFTADKNHLYARFPSSSLLPENLLQNERFLVFYPLHYNTYSIGYLAMDGISEAAKLNLHESIFNFLEIAIENVRKKCLLRQLNETLDDLYVRDSLTGLYNRFGYKRYGQQVFDRCMIEDGGVQVIFVDMDDMKSINDQHGHEAGDMAIRLTAQILRDACLPTDFIMRYGGDEFLVIASCHSAALAKTISQAVVGSNQKGDMPFLLSLSIGVIHTDAQEKRTLDACVQAADALMYDNKARRKRVRSWITG